MKRGGEGGGEAPGFRSLIHSLVRLTMHTRTPLSLLLNSCFGISLGKGPACLILANICFRLAGRILGASSGVSFTVWLSGGVAAGSFLGRNPPLAVPVALLLFVFYVWEMVPDRSRRSLHHQRHHQRCLLGLWRCWWLWGIGVGGGDGFGEWLLPSCCCLRFFFFDGEIGWSTASWSPSSMTCADRVENVFMFAIINWNRTLTRNCNLCRHSIIAIQLFVIAIYVGIY